MRLDTVIKSQEGAPAAQAVGGSEIEVGRSHGHQRAVPWPSVGSLPWPLTREVVEIVGCSHLDVARVRQEVLERGLTLAVAVSDIELLQ
jgi:hypothetical protein